MCLQVLYVLCEQARELVLMAGFLPPHRLADQRKAVWTVPVVAKGDAGETARTQLTTVLCVAPAEYTKQRVQQVVQFLDTTLKVVCKSSQSWDRHMYTPPLPFQAGA